MMGAARALPVLVLVLHSFVSGVASACSFRLRGTTSQPATGTNGMGECGISSVVWRECDRCVIVSAGHNSEVLPVALRGSSDSMLAQTAGDDLAAACFQVSTHGHLFTASAEQHNGRAIFGMMSPTRARTPDLCSHGWMSTCECAHVGATAAESGEALTTDLRVCSASRTGAVRLPVRALVRRVGRMHPSRQYRCADAALCVRYTLRCILRRRRP